MRLSLALAALLALFCAGPATAQNSAPTVDVLDLMVPGPMGDRAQGNPNAPVTVIEYASMTCPHCQRFHTDTYPALKSRYIDTGKVYFIIREFPLDPLAFAAFMVARCSGDRYFEVIEALFAHQEEWAFVDRPVDAMLTFTGPHGVATQQQFEECVGRQDAFEHIEEVATRGYEEFGVEGTPTFFFNGNRIVGEIPIEGIDHIISLLLGSPS
jgi:protein-disulfide isomerase